MIQYQPKQCESYKYYSRCQDQPARPTLCRPVPFVPETSSVLRTNSVPTVSASSVVLFCGSRFASFNSISSRSGATRLRLAHSGSVFQATRLICFTNSRSLLSVELMRIHRQPTRSSIANLSHVLDGASRCFARSPFTICRNCAIHSSVSACGCSPLQPTSGNYAPVCTNEKDIFHFTFVSFCSNSWLAGEARARADNGFKEQGGLKADSAG